MNDLVDLCDLAGALRASGVKIDRNFEETFSDLEGSDNSHLIQEVQERLEEYFWALRLPEHPTIYDVLVLSLRSKDVIATFNWDPLLYFACLRNHKVAPLPRVLYLHGNVAIGYCLEDKKKGLFGTACSVCGSPYKASPLLYPIKRKGYSANPYISKEWDALKRALTGAFMLTVFGYAAPASDTEALEIMTAAWGSVGERTFEQTEIIDIKDEADLRSTWSPFIHTHHYDIRKDFFDSWIAQHPRRSCEAAWQQFFEARFISTNPAPRTEDLTSLQAWFASLLNAEAADQIDAES